jgi:hypothetical protein
MKRGSLVSFLAKNLEYVSSIQNKSLSFGKNLVDLIESGLFPFLFLSPPALDELQKQPSKPPSQICFLLRNGCAVSSLSRETACIDFQLHFSLICLGIPESIYNRKKSTVFNFLRASVTYYFIYRATEGSRLYHHFIFDISKEITQAAPLTPSLFS